MKIALFSNAGWVPSGYGRQADIWAPQWVSLGHEVAVLAYCGLHGAPLRHNGITVYPGSTEDMWAQDVMKGHYGHFGADLLITLMDAWVLDGTRLADGMNVAHWMPIDCTPLSQADRRVLDVGGGQPIAMSRHGLRQLEDAGYPALYAPHAVDCSVFRPVEDREQIRERAGFAGKFVIGINAANQDPNRKAFGEQFAAFEVFHERHPDSVLLVHSRVSTKNGVNLERLRDDCGLSEGAVQFADQYLYAAGFTPTSEVATWSGVLDVLSNCTYGEGFGIPVIEAQAAGTPVVVTQAASMTELCGSGWLVETDPVDDRFWNRGHDARWFRPKPRKIVDAWEQAYACWANGEMGPVREKARAFALSYDVNRVRDEYWKPVLAELEARL